MLNSYCISSVKAKQSHHAIALRLAVPRHLLLLTVIAMYALYNIVIYIENVSSSVGSTIRNNK